MHEGLDSVYQRALALYLEERFIDCQVNRSGRCRRLSPFFHQVDPLTFEVGDTPICDVLDVLYAGPLQERSG